MYYFLYSNLHIHPQAGRPLSHWDFSDSLGFCLGWGDAKKAHPRILTHCLFSCHPVPQSISLSYTQVLQSTPSSPKYAFYEPQFPSPYGPTHPHPASPLYSVLWSTDPGERPRNSRQEVEVGRHELRVDACPGPTTPQHPYSTGRRETEEDPKTASLWLGLSECWRQPLTSTLRPPLRMDPSVSSSPSTQARCSLPCPAHHKTLTFSKKSVPILREEVSPIPLGLSLTSTESEKEILKAMWGTSSISGLSSWPDTFYRQWLSCLGCSHSTFLHMASCGQWDNQYL